MDSAEGDGGPGLLGVFGEAEGSGHGGPTHRHGAQATPQTDILQESYEKFVARQFVLEIIVSFNILLNNLHSI